MKDRVRSILDGVVGRFGPDAPLPFDVDSSLPGHIKRDARDLLIIDALDDSLVFGPWADPSAKEVPQYIAAATSAAGALVFDVAGITSKARSGSQASTRTYRARGVVAGIPVKYLRSPNFFTLTAFFPGGVRVCRRFAGAMLGGEHLVDNAGSVDQPQVQFVVSVGADAVQSGPPGDDRIGHRHALGVGEVVAGGHEHFLHLESPLLAVVHGPSEGIQANLADRAVVGDGQRVQREG